MGSHLPMGMHLSRLLRRGIPPTLASLNFLLVDPLGGGADITITGTNLAAAISVTVGGTAATITGTTATTVSIQAPAKAAGTYDVVVTTPAGSDTLTSALEYWAPNTDAACTALWERQNYAYNNGSTAGLWTARTGPNLSNTPGPPAAGSGAPDFDGSGHLAAAVALNTLHGTSEGTHFAVSSFENTDALVLSGGGGGGPAANPMITSNAGTGTIGLAAGRNAGTPGFTFQVAVSANTCPFIAATENVQHAVIGRFTGGGTPTVEINVDGGSFTSLAGTNTAWSSSGGVLNVGARYDGSRVYRGEMRALGHLNVAASSTFAAKFYQWAQQRHGVT